MSLIATIPVARSSAGPFAPRISPPFRVRLRNPPLNPTFRLSLSARITFRAWQPFPRIPLASAACRVSAIRNSPPAPFGAFRSWRIRLSATAEAGGAAEAESAPGALAKGEAGVCWDGGEEGEVMAQQQKSQWAYAAMPTTCPAFTACSSKGEAGVCWDGGEEGEVMAQQQKSQWAYAAMPTTCPAFTACSNRGEGVVGVGGEEGEVMAETEEAVGICCYANDLPGIHGVLKQRFADFIVNEVAPDGTVVHLTHLHVPPALLVQEQQAQQQARRREAESLGELVDAQGVLAQLRQALGGSGEGEGGGGGGLRDEDDARKLLQLLEGIKGIQLWWKEKKRAGEEGEKEGGEEGAGGERAEGSVQGGEVGKMGEVGEAGGGAPPPMPEPVVFAASADKAYRATMHAFIKSYPFLVSDTIDAPQGPPYRCVRLRFLPPPALNLKGAGGRAGERGGRGDGGQRGGDGRGWREGRWGGKRGGRGGKWGKRGREEWEGGDRKRGKRDGGDGDGEDRGEGGDGGEGEGQGGEQGEEEQPAFDRRGRKGADGVPATTARRFLMCVPGIGENSSMFHVLKENKDTNEAMALVGRYLGVQPRALGFSGTKDKRAVTVQRVTVSNQSARKVASLNAKLFGIRVGDYRLVDQPLVLGQLAGNRFIVTLRAVRAPSVDAITAAAEGLGSHGIINYFGLQVGAAACCLLLLGAVGLRKAAPVTRLKPPMLTLHPPMLTLHPPMLTLHPPMLTLHPPMLTLHPPMLTLHPPMLTLHPPWALVWRGAGGDTRYEQSPAHFTPNFSSSLILTSVPHRAHPCPPSPATAPWEQRFGVGPVATHTVGAALLRGDWQGAVDLLLKPRDGDILSAPVLPHPHPLTSPCLALLAHALP
ncbi:unnamed protein product [Closterium sp. NIES-65]|nr:unnamed protein product [Closterium sp. NIES-65]